VTFYSTIASPDRHVDLVLALRVEGIPVAFVERTVPAAVATALTGYTQFAGLTRVDEGEAVLDMQERREMAATLAVELLDDSTRTLAALFAVNRRAVAYARTDRTTADTTITFDPTGVAAHRQHRRRDARAEHSGQQPSPYMATRRGPPPTVSRFTSCRPIGRDAGRTCTGTR